MPYAYIPTLYQVLKLRTIVYNTTVTLCMVNCKECGLFQDASVSERTEENRENSNTGYSNRLPLECESEALSQGKIG